MLGKNFIFPLLVIYQWGYDQTLRHDEKFDNPSTKFSSYVFLLLIAIQVKKKGTINSFYSMRWSCCIILEMNLYVHFVYLLKHVGYLDEDLKFVYKVSHKSKFKWVGVCSWCSRGVWTYIG